MNFVKIFQDVVRSVGAKAAIIENGKELSYNELWSLIIRLSKGMYRIGLRERDRVALILPQGSEFIYCFFALLKIKVIVSPLSPDLTPFEYRKVVANLKPHGIITTRLFLEKIRGDAFLWDHRITIVLDSAEIKLMRGDVYLLSELFSEDRGGHAEVFDSADDAPATINYTYRGTGEPLGAVLTHGNYIDGVSTYIKTTRIVMRHNVLSCLPLHHIYPLVGCVLAPLLGGASVIITKNYMPRFILNTINDHNINYFTVVPSLYVLLMQAYKEKDHSLKSLECCITGGAYMDREVQNDIRKRMGFNVLQGYGLTECFILSWNQHDANKAGSIGLPFGAGIQIKIVGDNGVEAGCGEIGEIIVKTPAMMLRYYDNPEETNRAFRDGWFYTGDYGYRDRDGYLYFAGVKKKIAKVGGNMVDLKEVEAVLLSNASVAKASVRPRPDRLWGSVLEADIVLHHTRVTNEAELKSYCLERLSTYKVPKYMRMQVEVA